MITTLVFIIRLSSGQSRCVTGTKSEAVEAAEKMVKGTGLTYEVI